MKKTQVALMLTTIVGLAGCSDVALTDASESSAFEPLICTQYEVVGAVDAYGIRKHSKADVEYVTLIPPPGISGPEVGFKASVVPGSRITIVKVMRSNYWFDSNIAFIVELEGISIPENAVVRIELFRGNEGEDRLHLNPDIYRKVSQRECPR